MKVLFILPLFFIPGVIYAEQFGIALSPTCITMIKNDFPTDCPTYDDIMMLFPDTTNQNMVGSFSIIDGITQRGPSQMQHPYQFYKYHSGNVQWIDPDSETRKNIKMIYIEPSLPEYKTAASNKMSNGTISFAKDRYINPNCSETKITASNWVFLLGDTLNFLLNDCDYAFTSFDGIVTKKFAKSYQDITTSYKYIHDKWVAENLIKCKVRNCI